MEFAQISWNDLLMGDGTPYVVQTVTGLHDTPPARSGRMARARAHGSIPGPKYLDARTLTATIEVNGPHRDGDVYEAFSRAHVVGTDEVGEFRAKVRGVAGGREIVLFGSCERLNLAVDQDYWAGVGHADVQWVCDDPRIYDAESTTVDAAMADVSGTGLTFPITFPITFGGAISGGLFTTNNEGEFPAPWTATMTGPVTNPRLENVTTGQTIRFSGSLAAGETLYLSSDEKAVLLNGTASRYYWLAAGSEWFDLAPGVNDLRFAGTAGAGSIQLEFRSAWI